MKLDLTQDEALVLFEWLSRLDERDALPCEDPAEELEIWSVIAQFEKALAEPFRKDYGELVEAARARIRGGEANG